MSDFDNTSTKTPTCIPLRAYKFIYAALVVKLIFLFAFAYNTRFVMDEFWQLGQSKYLFNGFYDTIWPAKTVGYAVFYQMSHWIGWDAQSILLLGRMQTGLLACATLALLYAIARSINQDRIKAVLIILLVLCFSTFIERIFRTRSEPLALFFAMAALYVVVRHHCLATRSLVIAGLLSGLAFLATQKSVYFNVALGVALVAPGMVTGRFLAAIKNGAIFTAGWAIPIIIYCFVFGAGDFLLVAKSIIVGPVEVATKGQSYYSGFGQFIAQTVQRNAALYFLGIAGALLTITRMPQLSQPRRTVIIFSGTICALVFSHNQLWPYMFIWAIPFIALWLPEALGFLATRSNRPYLYLLVVSAIFIFSSVRNISYLKHDNSDALRVVRQAESLLPRTGTYFDGIGMLPNRMESSRRWLDARRVSLTKADGSASDILATLKSNPPDLIIKSYRTEAIKDVLMGFVENRYIEITGNIMLPGREVVNAGQTEFDVPVAGQYNIYNQAGLPIETNAIVDGSAKSFPVWLSTGMHHIQFAQHQNRRLILPDAPTYSPFPADTHVPRIFSGIYWY